MRIFSRSKHYLYIILLFLICTANYSRSLFYDFVFEDKSLIVDNPYIKNLRYIAKIFKTDLYVLAYDATKPNYYRPIETMSFMVDYKLWKLNPFGYHLTNVLVHFLNVILVYIIIYLLFNNLFIAVVSSLLFCIHPINIAAVVFITGRSDLFAALFILSTFLCTILLLRYPINQKTYLTLIILFSLLVLLSRENAVFMPLGVLLLSFFVRGDKKYKILCFLLTGLVVVSFLYFRTAFLNIPLARNDFLSMPILLKLINFLHIIVSYVSLLVIPINLYLMHVTTPIVAALDIRLWLTLGFIFIILILWYVKRQNKILMFGILWFLLFISQAFFLMTGFYGNKVNMFEHWAYLASVGIYIIASYLFCLCREYIKITIYPLITIILVVYIILTQINYSNFKDSVTLSKHILRFNSLNTEAHKELARIYLEEKQYRNAYEHIDTALKLKPFDPDLYLLLGIYYEDTGNIERAVATYEKLLKIEPNSARANNNLGAIYFNKGNSDKAKLFFQHAIDLNPSLFEPYLNMAKLCTKINVINDAVSFYQQTIKLNPDFKEAFVNLAKIYLNKRDFNSAIDILNKALNSGHRVESVLMLLGIANRELGFDTKAAYYFSELSKLGPKSQETMLNMGIFYANRGQLNKAIEIWQEGLRNSPGNKIIKENIDKAKELLRQGR